MNSTLSPELLAALQDKIDAANTVAVFGHENIDGDALGSILWFGRLLEKLGKDVSYFTSLPPAASYNFIPWIEKVQTTFDYEKTYDLIVFLDFTGYGRIKWLTENHQSYFDKANRIIIDHHLDHKMEWSLEIKDTDSSSCCGWLYEICHELWPTIIDEDIATYFYLWLTTDTWNFMRGKSPERDFSIASWLLAKWAKREFIIKNLFYAGKPELLDMGKIILNRATITDHIMHIRYTQDELNSYNLADDDVEILQIPLKSIAWIPMFLRLRDMWTYRSGSMRSWWTADWRRISVQKIAITFPVWWGHMYASGFTCERDMTLSLEEDVKRIVTYINWEVEKQLAE